MELGKDVYIKSGFDDEEEIKVVKPIVKKTK